MRKTPNLFVRAGDGTLTREINPECQWVVDGVGVATEKLDGSNVRITTRCGEIVRVEARQNPKRDHKARGIIHPWYRDAQEPQHKWLLEAAANTDTSDWPDGSHCAEAMGPKIQGNPLGLERHICHPFFLKPLVVHAAPRDWSGLRAFLATQDSLFSPGHLSEGLVFHHPDGKRRAKAKRKDICK